VKKPFTLYPTRRKEMSHDSIPRHSPVTQACNDPAYIAEELRGLAALVRVADLEELPDPSVVNFYLANALDGFAGRLDQ